MIDFLTAVLRRPTLSWWDLLDIGIVSFLIYELLLLIRGTRAAQMALSGGFIIGLYSMLHPSVQCWSDRRHSSAGL